VSPATFKLIGQEVPNMTALSRTLDSLKVGLPVASQGLTMFPLLEPAAPERSYLLLDEALDADLAEVSEISQGGSVPELLFVNRSDRDILLLDGEELVGAKQNRVINLSILIGAATSVKIPVSCVEAGRWAWRSTRFSSGKRKLNASARRAKMRGVSGSLERNGERATGQIQSEVWRSVEEKMGVLACASPTRSLHDVYDSVEARLEPVRAAFLPVTHQVGAAFAIAGTIVGVDLFDAHSTLVKMLPKLVDSYAVDALERAVVDADAAPAGTSMEDVARLLHRIGSATAKEYAAIGKGTDLRIESMRVHGAALLVDGHITHFSAFPE